MNNTKDSEHVKGAHTSDGAERSNLMTREEFLRRVLYTGEITKIAQHLAVVIFLVSEGRNQLNLSVRDLERITGWSRPTIKDHLSELEVFFRVTFPGGSAKALFELQGVIEDAIAAAVVAGSLNPKLPQNLVAKQPAAKVVASQVAAKGFAAKEVATNFVVSQPAGNPFVASQIAAGLLATSLATTPVMASQVATDPPFVASQVATNELVANQTAANSLSRERESIKGNSNLSLSYTTPRASEEATEEEELVELNGVGIKGPGFKLAYAAIDQVAGLINMSKERARAIATICAYDWAANGEKPKSPMARVKRAIMSDYNEGQVQEVKLEAAKVTSKGRGFESFEETAREVVAEMERKEREAKRWTR